LKVTVTVRFAVRLSVQGFVLAGESHPAQLPNTELVGVAVSVTAVPLANWVRHGAGLEQLNPNGELATVPAPFPAKVRVRTGAPPPPELVKQTTFPVIYPVTIAPDEDKPPELVLVLSVAETSDPPQVIPVTVRRPVESTVIICVSFEAHVTWLVMSLVTGGWI
jgi:hypothetical protein